MPHTATQQSTLFINNLHCPSCVSSIHAVLTSPPLSLPPDSVSISLLTGLVTFAHPAGIPFARVASALADAGFQVTQEGEERTPAAVHSSKDSAWFTTKRSREKREREAREAEERRAEAHRATCKACQGGEEPKGKAKECLVNMQEGVTTTEIAVEGMTCASCVGAIERILSPHSTPGIRETVVTLLPGRAVVKHVGVPEAKLVELLEDGGYGAEVILSSGPVVGQGGGWMETKFVIDGMTCASCVTSMNSILGSLPGIRSFQVTLLPALAVVVHDPHLISAEKLASEIEDGGYGAELVSSQPIVDGTSQGSAVREVKLRIEGFYCEKCPAALNELLTSLEQSSELKSFTPLSLSNPVTTLAYTPAPPRGFTLRKLRSLVIASGPFTLIPLRAADTLTLLARRAQARESRSIAIRLLVTFVFAIPTFIIAIVAMSLLSSDHSLRRYFETPIWGAASRGTVALFVLATPVQFGVGSVFYERSWKSLRGVWMRRGWRDRFLRWGSMDTLVALGTTAGWAASVAFLALDVQAGKQAMSGEMGYFDSSVFLMLFILAGRWLEAVSKKRTGEAVEALGQMKAATGLLWKGDARSELSKEDDEKALSIISDGEPSSPGSTEEVAVDFLERADIILIPSGSSVPLDACLLPHSPSSNFDESSLTGESHPILKGAGDVVFAGSTNLGPSAVVARVETGPGQTMMDGIVSAVRDAMGRKASIERVADILTGYFVPAIVVIAILTFIIWIARGYAGDLPASWLQGKEGRKGGWVLFAVQFTVAVLVVACPCGIGLAAPTAQMVGTGMAARLGIVPYGGGEAFQNATKIDCVVFDKTGTATTGSFKVVDTHLFLLPAGLQGLAAPSTIWKILESVEATSNHPISLGIRQFCQEQTSPKSSLGVHCLKSEEIPGRGLSALVSVADDRLDVLVGNEALMKDNAVLYEDATSVQNLISQWSDLGSSVVLVALRRHATSVENPEPQEDFHLTTLVGVQDPPRAEVAHVVRELEKLGIVSFLCTGDNRSTALAIARRIGIEEAHVFAGVLPVEKQACIERLQRGEAADSIAALRGRASWWRRKLSRRQDLTRAKVLFVGDGINDIVALTQSDVGVSMGTGAAVALSSSDFCLLSSNLLSLLTLLALAKATFHKILTNFGWACLFNTVLIPIAAGAFYDLGRTRLPPVWASLAMALSSVSVVTNSLILRWTFRVPVSVTSYSNTAT